MVGYYNQGVPTTVDLENNSNQKKYTVNQTNKKGFVISKPLCALMAVGAFLLALLVGLIVFFLVPRYCNGEKPPEALTHTSNISKAQLLGATSNNKAEEKSEVLKAEDDVDERLPRSIEPIHYRIQILPDLQNFTTSGSVTMTLSVSKSTNEIIFHLKDITILEQSVTVNTTKENSNPLKIYSQEYLPGDKYRIVLDQPLNKDEQYVLYLEYTGILNKHLKGFYGSRYSDARREERVIASTQFSPTDARRAFPCFDEPSFKAKFKIIIGRPSNMLTLSNMPLYNSTAIQNDERLVKRDDDTTAWFWDEYPETPKMSTYLVAFIVHDLRHEPNPYPLMKFWAREQIASNTAYASEIGIKMLRFFENYFDIKFPLSKIDIVAVPSFGFNAMENWGLITFKESKLLYDPYSSTNEDKREIASVLGHELAHQWFGNLVTPKFWNDLWLKEGFATYMQYLGVNHAEPKWKFLDEFPLDIIKAMESDAFESSRPLSSDTVKNSAQIQQLFDSISYSKGAVIIRMMNHLLGQKTFKEGLIKFLKKYQYDNADRDDLFASLTEQAHTNNILNIEEDVKTIMKSWTEQAGFPVVNANVDYEQQKIKISQKRFYFHQKDEKSNWWIPISFTTNATNNRPNFTDTLPKFWLKGEYEMEEDVNVTHNDWYLLNLLKTGYFIVNYDERNWRKLTEDIMLFTPAIRAQLISDSMDLARANLLDYEIPLNLIANMAIQDNNIMLMPTKVAFIKLEFLSNVLSATPAFGLFEEYHRNIFQETYKKVILEDTVDDYITRSIRSTVLKWSCTSPDSRCTHMAKTAFRDWIVRNREVPHNLRHIVYCTAIREGGEIEWDFAYRKFLESSSPSEKNTILDALGCTRLKWLLSRYLDKLLLDPSIRIQDADRLFDSVAQNKVGTQIAFDFLRKNWNAIIKQYGDGFNIVAKMVKRLGVQLTTEFELSELIRFRDSIKDNVAVTDQAFAFAIKSVKANVEWMEKNYNQVEQWFKMNRDIRSRIIEKLKMKQYLQSIPQLASGS